MVLVVFASSVSRVTLSLLPLLPSKEGTQKDPFRLSDIEMTALSKLHEARNSTGISRWKDSKKDDLHCAKEAQCDDHRGR